MVFKDPILGKNIDLIVGDTVQLKDGSHAEIVLTSDTDKILSGDLIVKNAAGQHKVITIEEVRTVLTLIFDIVRFIKQIFGK